MGKPQWYMMDTLFDTKSEHMITTAEGERGYVRGKVEDHYIFRVDFPDTYNEEIVEHMYSQILLAAEHMGIDKEKVVIFPSNVDVCRLVPCDESMHEKLEKLADEQRELMKTAVDSSEAN